jgi:hypothetical protein
MAVAVGRSRRFDQDAETTGVEQRHARKVDHGVTAGWIAMTARLHRGEQPAKRRRGCNVDVAADRDDDGVAVGGSHRYLESVVVRHLTSPPVRGPARGRPTS